MSIEVVNADIFKLPVDAIINTVNCNGVMGKGLALQFKKHFKENFVFYKNMCNKKALTPGKLCIYHHVDILRDQYIINFPTKDDWKKPSQMQYIHDGMKSLILWLNQHSHIKTIAIPALGCSNGQLSWNQVKPVIESYVSQKPDVKFYLIPPQE